jgi:hypothetical protein
MLLSPKFYPFLGCAQCFIKDCRPHFLGDFLYPQYYGKPRNSSTPYEAGIFSYSCQHWCGEVFMSERNIKLNAMEEGELLKAIRDLPIAILVSITGQVKRANHNIDINIIINF